MAEDRQVVRRETPARHVLLVASLGVFLSFVDATILNVAFPDIRRSFPEAGIAELSWVFNAYNIVFAAFLVAAGRIADLLGRRRMFHAGIGVFTIASAFCAVAATPGQLIAARVLQAVGAALLVPSSLALVLEAYPAGRRAHAVSMWGASAALAAGLGPSLGGVLVDATDWRVAFVVNLPIGVLAIVLGRRVLIESRAPGRRNVPDLAGALVLALGMAALTLGIVQGGEWGWTSPAVGASFAAAAALAGLFVRRCAAHPAPIVDLALVRVRSFAVATSLTALVAAAFFANLLCGVLFLTSVWGYSLLDAGLAITPAPFAAVACAGLWARLAEARGFRGAITAGLLVYSAGIAVYLLHVGPEPDFLGAWLPAQLLSGAGAAAALPLLQSAALAGVPDGRFATAAAINATARQTGAAVGVAVLVAVLGTPAPAEAVAAFDRAWTVALCSFLVAAGGAAALGRLRPAAAADDAADDPLAPPEAVRLVRAIESESAPASRWIAGATDGLAADLLDASAAATLATVPAFAELPLEDRQRLADRATRVHVVAGDWLFRCGEQGDSLYVVLRGRLEVVGEDRRVLSTLGAGTVVGELALLGGGSRAACVRARRDSELLRVDRSDFEEVAESSPSVGLGLARCVVAHLEATRDRPDTRRERPKAIAVIPLHDGARAREVADRLAEALAPRRRTIRLDALEAVLQAEWQERLPECLRLLDECERTAEHVVLAATGVPTRDPWACFCVRQADLVIGVVDGSAPPPECLALTPRLKGCEVVVTGQGDLACWIDAVAPRAVHRFGDEAISALARRIAGHAVGVVLSGGGARAFAHIGALAELRGAGITIDRFGGVSMGAMIGALAASGADPAEIDARCHEEWVRRNPLGDWTLSRSSLIRGDRARAMLTRVLGSGRIEELPHRFYALSCDLVSGEPVIHRTGRVDDAVAASVCLPGFAPAIEAGGRLLVDGGVLDNLPIGEMAQANEGPVIAIDVTRRFTAPDAQPGVRETLMRVALLGSADTAVAADREADLLITPADCGAGLLEFHQIDRLEEAGREAARAALADASGALFGDTGRRRASAMPERVAAA